MSVSVGKGKKKVVVICSKCGLRGEYDYSPYLSPVDYFSKFLDDYEAGRLTEGVAGVEEGEG